MIVIPACGEGTRFKQAGYTEPKHLIPLGGKAMIDWVIDNVTNLDPGNVVVVTQDMVGKTRGAIDTVLKAQNLIPPYEPLVIANCDQLLQFPEDWGHPSADGIIFTFRSNNSAHSYVTTTELYGDLIKGIVEKPYKPPSDQAVSGVYWFKEAGDFLEACHEVQQRSDGGEQYISSALKVMLEWGYFLYAVDAPTAILGTPEDFQRFETALSIARAA